MGSPEINFVWNSAVLTSAGAALAPPINGPRPVPFDMQVKGSWANIGNKIQDVIFMNAPRMRYSYGPTLTPPAVTVLNDLRMPLEDDNAPVYRMYNPLEFTTLTIPGGSNLWLNMVESVADIPLDNHPGGHTFGLSLSPIESGVHRLGWCWDALGPNSGGPSALLGNPIHGGLRSVPFDADIMGISWACWRSPGSGVSRAHVLIGDRGTPVEDMDVLWEVSINPGEDYLMRYVDTGFSTGILRSGQVLGLLDVTDTQSASEFVDVAVWVHQRTT